MLLTRFYDALLTVAYPQVCGVCGGSVEERRLGVACVACWSATRIFNGTETICWKCGAMLLPESITTDRTTERIGDRGDSVAFRGVRAFGVNEKLLRKSGGALKRKPHLSGVVRDLLVTAAQREPLDQAT